MTSDQAPALWPFVNGPGLPSTGALMGVDVSSGAGFFADVAGWVQDETIPVTNTNVVVLGKPGVGKSATCKGYVLRMLDFGYRTLIAGDVKDEYEPLCRALGVEPWAVGPGMTTRVNPLAIGPLQQGWERLDAAEQQRRAAIVFKRWLTLVRALVASQRIGELPVPFGPSDAVAVRHALEMLTGYDRGATHLQETTIPHLWALLDTPTEELVRRCRYAGVRQFLDETRTLRDALAQLVSGPLSGMFDDHTNVEIDWAAPIQSLSLSRLKVLGDEAQGIALACMNSWARGMRELAPAGDLRIVLRDENWLQLRLGIEMVKSFDADLRLSRNDGDIQLAVSHKPNDYRSVGAADSQATAIAKELLHLADTKILCGQDPTVAHELQTLLGLNTVATDAITGWAMHGKGRALWCVGDRRYKVQTVLHPLEQKITYTNEALAGARAA